MKKTKPIIIGKEALVGLIVDKCEANKDDENKKITKKDTRMYLEAFLEVVEEQLRAGNKIQLVGFGTFEVVERAAREGRNPQTGETMMFNATKTPKFKPGKPLKDAINA